MNMVDSLQYNIKEIDMPQTVAFCSVAGCSRKVDAAGLCKMHYQRRRAYGDPLAGRTPNGEHKEWLLNHVNWPGDACLIWPYTRSSAGYAFTEASRSLPVSTKSKLAHRIMCELKNGAPPTLKHHAAHSCGKGADGCVNPNHIRWATADENAADKVVHGTNRRPDSQKLSEADILQIAASNEPNWMLAARFGVTKRYINQIRYGGKRAEQLGLAIEKIDRRKLTGADRIQAPTFGNRTELSEDAIAHIKASSETQAALAKRFGVGQATISRIKAGTYQSKYRKDRK